MPGSGSPPQFTPEELTNIATFATDAARAQYHLYGLTPREELLVRRHFSEPRARLLDIGCGYGRTTVPLHRMGYRAVGIDIVERMIVEARKGHPEVPWALMSATDLAATDASVGYVLFSANGIDCISPLPRRDQALREIHRVLRPGGCFIYSAHNWLAQMVTAGRNAKRREHLWLNVRRGRLAPGYLRVPQAEGELVLYYGTPPGEMRRLRRAGFRRVTMHSGKISPRFDGRGRWANYLFDAWPYYVAYR
jgi:SAM-dependent methyltransferase